MVDIAYIYGLLDPRTNQVRYVGSTENPKWREAYHLSHPHSKPMKQWITELQEDTNSKPIFFLLEEVVCSDRALREAYWIHHFNEDGILLNKHIKVKSYTPKIRRLEYINDCLTPALDALKVLLEQSPGLTAEQIGECLNISKAVAVNRISELKKQVALEKYGERGLTQYRLIANSKEACDERTTSKQN